MLAILSSDCTSTVWIFWGSHRFYSTSWAEESERYSGAGSDAVMRFSC